jgi:hypothetical protein
MTNTNTNTNTNAAPNTVREAKAKTPAQLKREAIAAKVKAAIKAAEKRDAVKAKTAATRKAKKEREAAKAKQVAATSIAKSVAQNFKSNTGKGQPRIVVLRNGAAGASFAAQRATAVSYGAARMYAEHLTSLWGEGWEAIKPDTTNENEKSVLVQANAERKAFQAVCKDRGHSNPSVAWGQVKRSASTMLDASGKAVAKPGRERAGKVGLAAAEDRLKSAYRKLYRMQEQADCPEVIGEICTEIGALLVKRFKTNLTALNT